MELTEDRWKRLQELYWAAMKLAEADRIVFAERETDGDPQLRAELAGMLAHSSEASHNIGEVIARVAGTASAAPAPVAWVGRRFGPYRLLREIGRGGMGLVFEAQRDDDEFRQTVALKIAPQWRHDAFLHERIRHERQILAGLLHPNIARLLDGGTEDGVPYFAMEFVHGMPITEHARTRGLTLRERIVLFRQVLSAVACAHQNLIVHRDIKPGNILVDDSGTPKLLDFGIAKLLHEEAPSTTMGALLWTPDYTSPEQIQGKPITTRTDIYSLGLVLYELLSEQRCRDSDGTPPAELIRVICEEEPPAPSRIAQTAGKRALARQLEGDLDTIVDMAIRKEPERRYGSAEEFSGDLGRYLDGLPVQARAGSFLYRAGRHLRRHKTIVVAAILILASSVTGLVATLHQARRAERRFQQVRALANTFVFDVHDRIRPLAGSIEARKAIVQTAITYLENLTLESEGDLPLRRELAEAYLKVGDAQGYPNEENLGDRAGARRSYLRAQGMLLSLVNSGDRQSRSGLASAHLRLGMLHKEDGDAKAALTEMQAARRILDPVLKDQPDDGGVLSTASGLYMELTRLLVGLRDSAASETAQRNMEIAQHRLALDPARFEHRLALASAYSSLGTAHYGSGNVEQARHNFRKCVEIREKIVADRPDDTIGRHDLMIGYGHLGDALNMQNGESIADPEAAATAFSKALELAVWHQEHDPLDRRSAFDVASAQLRLGSAFLDSGRTAAGLAHLRDAQRNLLSLLKDDPQNYRFRIAAATVRRYTGEALATLGNRDEAAQALRECINESGPLRRGPNSVAAAQQELLARLRLAVLWSEPPDPRAAPLADNVAAELSQLAPGTLRPWMRAVAERDLGRAYRRIGRAEEARSWLEKSRRRWLEMAVAPAVDALRAKEVAGLEAEMALVRGR